jgi:hypothetical protein
MIASFVLRFAPPTILCERPPPRVCDAYPSNLDRAIADAHALGRRHGESGECCVYRKPELAPRSPRDGNRSRNGFCSCQTADQQTQILT